MSLRRPTVALLVIYLLISPLGGAVQTPDCGILFPLHYCLFMLHINNLLACIKDVLFMTDDVIIEYFSARLSFILYPMFIIFASTFKVLTSLSLAIVLARFLAWRGALRWQPRSLRKDDSSLAKIGVILVSCSCGKWSPIDADVPQTASAINP